MISTSLIPENEIPFPVSVENQEGENPSKQALTNISFWKALLSFF
jgi:hypothetical protein